MTFLSAPAHAQISLGGLTGLTFDIPLSEDEREGLKPISVSTKDNVLRLEACRAGQQLSPYQYQPDHCSHIENTDGTRWMHGAQQVKGCLNLGCLVGEQEPTGVPLTQAPENTFKAVISEINEAEGSVTFVPYARACWEAFFSLHCTPYMFQVPGVELSLNEGDSYFLLAQGLPQLIPPDYGSALGYFFSSRLGQRQQQRCLDRRFNRIAHQASNSTSSMPSIQARRQPQSENEQFLAATVALANKYGLPPEDLLTVFSFETRGTLSPSVTNRDGYTGLIQFGEDTARDLGTSTAALRQITRVEQLVWVDRYFEQRGLPRGATTEQLYATVLVGNPGGNLDLTDANGTSVRSAINENFPAHRERAIALLQGAENLDTTQYAFENGICRTFEESGLIPNGVSTPPGVNGSGQATGSFRSPVPGAPITSYFGRRPPPCPACSTYHPGLDFGVAIGTPVGAIDGGRVVFSGWLDGYGNTVIIDHGNGYGSLSAHNDQNFARVGDLVSQGQTIANSGQTGRGTGPHLHLEIIENFNGDNIHSGTPVDPYPLLRGTL